MKKKIRILIIVASLLLAGGISIYYYHYSIHLAPNVSVDKFHLYIYDTDHFEDIVKKLEDKKVLKKLKYFVKVAKKEDYPNNIKPGHYLLTKGMDNDKLLNKLSAGHQDPVKVLFNTALTRERFCDIIAKQLMFNADTLLHLIKDETFIKKVAPDLNVENFWGIFLPNTYEFYWTVKPEKFVEKMYAEFNNFMNEKRKEKAKEINLSPIEVVVLASIVDAEILKKDEMPIVAGLYLNRLKRGMLLQADPTVIYAKQDFSIRRVLRRYLKVKSPYNTYLHKGLPPGPIRIASLAAIDAVLYYEKHNYLYMCAKDDFSGYHSFAATARQHQRNALKFRRELNRRRVWR